MKQYCLRIDNEIVTKGLLTMSGVVFMLFAFVNVFYFKEYLLCLFSESCPFALRMRKLWKDAEYGGY